MGLVLCLKKCKAYGDEWETSFGECFWSYLPTEQKAKDNVYLVAFSGHVEICVYIMFSNFNVIIIFNDLLSFLISMWFSLCLYDFARLSYFNAIFVTSLWFCSAFLFQCDSCSFSMILLSSLISMWFFLMFSMILLGVLISMWSFKGW